ncbi:hypothetical protein SEUCBS140593_007831 [Sporothrix eucalyptigena]|uniref:Uncharacterized protein n=1 Tax=Sporothrix eucalyptigena TaxID=1812306 RepID=A0ABP0CGH8_9PEZI
MADVMTHGELAGILRSRTVAVNESQIEAALRDAQSGPELATWAATHLTEDTLLTLDELELYDALQRSGREEEFASGDSAAPPLPVSESGLRAAIAALERSTATIEKQTDVLRQQQDAVAKLSVPQSSLSSRTDAAARHQQRWDTARAALVADVEQRGRDLDERVGDLAQQNRALAQRVQQTVDGLCRSDDTLLASLQKLGWALPAVPNPGDEHEKQQQKSIARLRDICLHLIKFGVETIRTKLDWLYLEALEAVPADAPQTASEDDVAGLQEELESLFSEILPVAQMSVEQQHLEPALRTLSGQNTKNLTRALLALDYVDECLAYLLEHVSLLTGRIDVAVAHHATTEAMLATARTELAVPVPTASSRKTAADNYQRRRLSNYGSPVRRRQSGAGSAHLRTRSGTVGASSSMVGSVDLKAQRRRSSGFGYDSFGAGAAAASPMDLLLESLSLLLPMEEPELAGNASTAAVETAARINARFLQTTLVERANKADDVAANAQEAFEATTTTSLADARRALAQARASVLAESPFGDVQLVDPEIDGSIAIMADEVRRLRERQAAVDADLAQARKKGSAKREQMVARWA